MVNTTDVVMGAVSATGALSETEALSAVAVPLSVPELPLPAQPTTKLPMSTKNPPARHMPS
jgi:hypothetical protein